MQYPTIAAPDMAARDAATHKYWQKALEFSGDTQLHHLVLQDRLKKIPVLQDTEKKTSKKQDAVKLMMTVRGAIKDADLEKLGAANKRGDTPLHLAVARGGREGNEICVYLCERELELMGNIKTAAAVNDPPAATVLQQPSTRENCLGETPIFLAALHGNMDAFFLLHAMHPIKESTPRSYYTRHDGNTILHIAVLGQHFELAYSIISKHPFLVDCKNNRKETPLHLLARSPTTFRSGYHLEPMDSLLFHLAWVPPPLEKNHVDPRMEQNFESIKGTLTPPPKKERGIFTKCHDLCNQFSKHRAEMTKEKSRSRTTDRSIGDYGGAKTRSASEQRTSARPRLHRALNEIFFFLGFIIEIVLRIFGSRFLKMDDIKRKRIRDNWATLVAAELVEMSNEWNFEPPRNNTDTPAPENAGNKNEEESSIFVAAKHGVVVIVEEILNKFPFAIHYEDKDEKNIVLLSVENRQYQVFEYLKKHHYSKNAFLRVDNQGNSISHLAAKPAKPVEPAKPAKPAEPDKPAKPEEPAKPSEPAKPTEPAKPAEPEEKSSFNSHSNILGAALQIQWDIKWFKYIGEKVEGQAWYNNDGKTAQTLFDENHIQLVGDAGKWLTTSATACSVVSGLVATVAFATSTSFPGGTDGGKPVLEGKTFFNVFVVASFFGLCFAVISVLSFLAILTSRLLPEDFENYLPTNLMVGLVSLFLSVVFMMVCFCSGHFFMLGSFCNNSYFIRRLVDIMSPFGFYALISFPVLAMFIGPHFSLFIDLIIITFGGKPWRSFARGFF